jgi:hypothetical protein
MINPAELVNDSLARSLPWKMPALQMRVFVLYLFFLRWTFIIQPARSEAGSANCCRELLVLIPPIFSPVSAALLPAPRELPYAGDPPGLDSVVCVA